MQFAHREPSGKLRQDFDQVDEELDLLGPMLAGARARGVADAFDLLAIPVIFLDGEGSVLHIGAHTPSLLGTELKVVNRHLVGESASVNQSLETLISTAISGRLTASSGDTVRIYRFGKPALRVRAMAFADAEADDMQLLKVVLIVEAVAADLGRECVPMARELASVGA